MYRRAGCEALRCKVRREGQWQKIGAVPLKEEVPLKERQTRRVGAVRFTQQHDTL